jgi:tRNA U34 5-carboxymethylaminomethyl modifying GTPase MnmE/TrmE
VKTSRGLEVIKERLQKEFEDKMDRKDTEVKALRKTIEVLEQKLNVRESENQEIEEVQTKYQKLVKELEMVCLCCKCLIQKISHLESVVDWINKGI